jgi:hypothetical protein
MASKDNVKNEAKLADGGIVYGPTRALVGEYQGVENDPEVISPLSDLQRIIADSTTNEVKIDTSGISNGLSNLNNTMNDVKSLLRSLNNKQSSITLDSQQIGTSQLIGNYNLA